MFTEYLIINIIYILFPILCYLLYTIYQKTFENKVNNLFFDLAILTSFYILLKYGAFSNEIYNILLVNLLLIISFYKKRVYTSCLIIICLILILYINYSYNLYGLFLNYLLLLPMYYYLVRINKKNYINVIACIINIIYILIFNYNIYLMFYIILIYFLSLFIIKLLDELKEIINLNSTIKILEKEKLLRNSLFKVTHEIKNPIAVCKGYLDMLDTKNSNQVNKYIPIIKEEINRTLNIIADFLDLTKLKINNSILDVVLLIEDTCNCAKSLTKNNNIKFEYIIPEEEILMEGDYERLKQVLINIIKNSIEALEEVKEGCVTLSAIKNKKNILIEIKDNGVGMDKKTLERIGEAFFTTKKNGTGLGVKLSKEIIEAHNGRITYKSDIGIGTTVNIKLKIKN